MKRFLPGIILTLFIVSNSTGLSCTGGYNGSVDSISIGTTTSEVNSLILVAQELGYFKENGLEINHIIYKSGVAAVNGISSGEVDLATGSEFAFAGKILAGENLLTITSICRSSVESLVVRRDRGIQNFIDLKGKTIGVPLGSRPEFALDRYLLIRGINPSEVNLVNVPANRSVDALINGEVDAVAVWEPYITQIKERMGDGVLVWDAQEDQPSYTLVMGTAEWIKDNPGSVQRFLESLAFAEKYIAAKQEDAIKLLGAKLNYDEAYLTGVWNDYRFSIMLGQALLVAIEDQARWIIRNENLELEIPDFVNHCYLEGLQAVKPEVVNIIR